MQAFKFLKRGAIGPVSGFAWPVPAKGAPGAWVDTGAEPSVCTQGVHACTEEQLAYWVNQELWAVELDGELTDAPDCVVAPRGRLLGPVQAWIDGGAKRFVDACHRRLALRLESTPAAAPWAGYLGDCEVYAGKGVWSTAAYIVAVTMARIGMAADRTDEWSGYRQERAWQSQWIVRQLIGA